MIRSISSGPPEDEMYDLCYVVADDDEEELLMMRLALTQQKKLLPIREFIDGQEVIDYLQRNSEIRDSKDIHWLVVLDMNMPILNGLDTLKAIRQHADWETIPVLLFVDSANKALIEQALRCGASACITRPKSMEEYGQLFDEFFRPYLRKADSTGT